MSGGAPTLPVPTPPWDVDDVFLAGLEDTSLPLDQFGHVGHVRFGYLLLQRHTYPEALNRARKTLVAYATAKSGSANNYNETVTAFYLFLIRARMEAIRGDGPLPRWGDFLRSCPELLSRSIESQYFEEGVLDSAFARDGIVFQPLPR